MRCRKIPRPPLCRHGPATSPAAEPHARAWFPCWRRHGQASITRMINKWARNAMCGSSVLTALRRWQKPNARRICRRRLCARRFAPCFVEKDGARTDIVVLGCTIRSWPTACARRRPGRWTGSIPPKGSPGAPRYRCSRLSTDLCRKAARHRRLYLRQGGFRHKPADANRTDNWLKQGYGPAQPARFLHRNGESICLPHQSPAKSRRRGIVRQAW